MKKYIHASFLFFTLAAISGVWMRLYQQTPFTWIPYDNILHAHSHLALLGWIFIASFILYLTLFWKDIKQKKQAFFILFGLFSASSLMFLAFLYQGYGLYSIVLSTIHIFIEYWAAAFIIKHLKKQAIKAAVRYFVMGAIIALVLSSIGPFALGFISANGLKGHAIFELAIYFYLHFQYNGWLTLFLIGLFSTFLYKRNIPFNEPLLKKAFWIYFFALFPGFLLSVLWVHAGTAIEILAAIGSIAQWIAVLLILIALKGAFKQLKKQYSSLTWRMLIISFSLLFIKSTLELGLIYPDLADLVNTTRSVIIGYLHLTLLGFISIFILVQYQIHGITSTSRFAAYSFSVFFIGFALNELLLFLQALSQWTGLFIIPCYANSLLLAAILLTLGVILTWFTVSYNNKNNY